MNRSKLQKIHQEEPLVPLGGGIIDSYSRFLLKNVDEIGTLESSLRTLLFFIPGRLRDSEVKLELAYTVSGLITLLHDHIVLKFLQRLTAQDEKKLNQFPALTPDSCVPFATCLTFINHSELLVEIFSKKKWGPKGGWISVFCVELLKCLLKVKLLLIQGPNSSSILSNSVHTSIPSLRDHREFKLMIQREVQNALHPHQNSPRLMDTWSAEKRKKFQFLRNGSNSYQLMHKSSKGTQISAIMEILFIFRPIVYLLTMGVFGQKSWKPWSLSLAVDAMSLAYNSGRIPWLGPLEKDEIGRRFFLLYYYLIRTPMFEAILSRSPRALKSLVNGLKNIPLIGTVIDALHEYALAYKSHYFYTSGTN